MSRKPVPCPIPGCGFNATFFCRYNAYLAVWQCARRRRHIFLHRHPEPIRG